MDQTKDQALKIAAQFIKALRKIGIRIREAYLFGSRAKGNALPDSDIDIAIVSGSFSGDRLSDWDLLAEVRRDIDVRIEAIPFRPEKFRDENPLVWEIKHSGIKI